MDTISRPAFGPPVNNGYPSLARAGNGDVWVAWVSRRTPDVRRRGSAGDLVASDHIMLKRRRGSAWAEEIRVSAEDGINSDPAVVAQGEGALAIWAARRGGNYDLYSRTIGADLKLSAEARLTQDAGADAAPRVAIAGDGTVWVVWEAVRGGRYRVLAMTGKDGRWSAPQTVSGAAEQAFRPSLAIGENGVVSVAWDGPAKDSYHCFLRQWSGGRWGEIAEVPSPEGLDAYAASAAAGRDGVVWVAFAQNPSAYADFGLRGSRTPGAPRPLVRVTRYRAGIWETWPGAPFSNADMPFLLAGANGGVQVVMQRLKGHMNFRLWESHLGRGGWSEAQQLDAGEEEYANVKFPGAPKVRVDARPSAVAAGGRVLMAYERGMGVFEDRQIAVREFAAAPEPAPESGYARMIAGAAPARRVDPPTTQRAGEYNVYFGDIHTHLLMDDGWTGTADQFYALARLRRGLDFGAYTPHAESNKLLGSEVALVQRIAPAFNRPGEFVGISGWEWTQGDFRVPREGHKHVINETDDQPFFSATEADSDSSRELARLMRGTTGLMFSHHVARGATGGANFDTVDTAVEPDLEIASHWGRFEYTGNPGRTRDEVSGSSVQDAWRKGLRVGVVGGSDNHDLYSERATALTAVLAKSLDRKSIFDALRNRRCYATTGEKIVLDVTVNGAPMGSMVRRAAGAVVKVAVTGTDELEKVEVVKFGKSAPYPFPVVYAVQPGGRTASFEWKDLEFRDEAAYYVRVTQRAEARIVQKQNFGSATAFPNEMAWSSPVWVSAR